MVEEVLYKGHYLSMSLLKSLYY